MLLLMELNLDFPKIRLDWFIANTLFDALLKNFSREDSFNTVRTKKISIMITDYCIWHLKM